jgi:hypothetical protein
VPDDECPHGLDPSWCTFCKRRAAGEPPKGVRRPATKAPSPAPARRKARTPAAPAAPLGPAQALAKLRKVVFHASAYGAWPDIAELGLRTSAELLGDIADPRLAEVRKRNIEVKQESGHQFVIRDQRPMVRAAIEAHLDGVGLDEWLDLLNQRVFFFARQKGLSTLLARYQESEGQDVLVFDTARLLAAAAGRAEVTTVSPAEPVSWNRCPCRGRSTFVAVDSFLGAVDDVEELTVVGGVEAVRDLVVRVVRYHPDRTTEVLLG